MVFKGHSDCSEEREEQTEKQGRPGVGWRTRARGELRACSGTGRGRAKHLGFVAQIGGWRWPLWGGRPQEVWGLWKGTRVLHSLDI